MKGFSIIYKKVLFVFIMVCLFLPLFQSIFGFIKLKPLKGAITESVSVPFSIQSWFSYSYQSQEEEYLTNTFGFRSLFIRIHNQIDYVLFNVANANGVIIGKNNVLFEEAYINAYNGLDFIGTDSINQILYRLKYVTDTLEKLNKHLIVVFAPGKASFYPECFPEKYKMPVSNFTNYKVLSFGANKIGLHVIDFNYWFLQNKFKSKYPLFPKHGIHWSKYGMVLAADSIIKKIEQLRRINMPNISYNNIEVKRPQDEDCDIGDGMNLWFDLKGFDMAYPNIIISDDQKLNRPDALVISDSFFWGMYNFGISNCFNKVHFWYYNKEVFPESANKIIYTDSLNIKQEVLNHDVIIIMATEANLKNIGWGFINNIYYQFKKL